MLLSCYSSTSTATGQLIDQVEKLAGQLSWTEGAHLRIGRVCGEWDVVVFVADGLVSEHIDRATTSSPPIVTAKHECLDNALFEILVKCCAIAAELHVEGVVPA